MPYTVLVECGLDGPNPGRWPKVATVPGIVGYMMTPVELTSLMVVLQPDPPLLDW